MVASQRRLTNESRKAFDYTPAIHRTHAALQRRVLQCRRWFGCGRGGRCTLDM